MAAHDSDEDRPLQVSDQDVLRDEQDLEDLLDGSQKRRGFLNRAPRDPNQPIDTTNPNESRRARRKDKHARRKRRRGYTDDESGQVDERETLVSGSDSDADSISSLTAFQEKVPLREGRRRFRYVIIFIFLTLLLLAMLYGTYKASTQDLRVMKRPSLMSNGSSLFGPTTILISLDGFRADFLEKTLTPTLNQFIRTGVSPKYMRPSFPSLTFPNHWTLATGLYPESHGVVGNSFWDPELEEEFWYTDPARSMDPKWWSSTGAEPIWSTAESQGVRSAVHMWPGSEAGVKPVPTYLDKYNGKEPLEDKVKKVFSYLDRPSEFDGENIANDQARPRFISFYVPNIDSAGHRFGPNSTETRKAVGEVDKMLAHLFGGFGERNLTDILNIVVVSDHGMASTSMDQLYQLDDLVNVDDIDHIDGWPLYGLRPKDGVDVQKFYEDLKKQTDSKEGLTTYLREDMPKQWHFSASDRIAPVWIVPDAGWAILKKDDFDIAAARKTGEEYSLKGLHGYDNYESRMRAIFIARGPAFPHEANSRVDVFQNTEVYGIVCQTLGIVPQPHNGTLKLPLATAGTHESEPGTNLDEPMPPAKEPGFFESTWNKFKDTIHKVAGIFAGAEAIKAAAASAAEKQDGDQHTGAESGAIHIGKIGTPAGASLDTDKINAAEAAALEGVLDQVKGDPKMVSAVQAAAAKFSSLKDQLGAAKQALEQGEKRKKKLKQKA